MKLLFKQRLFSWFDSYDIYHEDGSTAYVVKGELAWGHCLRIFSPGGDCLGLVKERVLTFLPRFELYESEQYLGELHREFTLFKPRFLLDFSGWEVDGEWTGWNYSVTDGSRTVMRLSKELWNFTDTYVMDIPNPKDALRCLMIVLAIDADKCRHNGG